MGTRLQHGGDTANGGIDNASQSQKDESNRGKTYCKGHGFFCCYELHSDCKRYLDLNSTLEWVD
eukprot:4637042-Amphidinium_carterae.1